MHILSQIINYKTYSLYIAQRFEFSDETKNLRNLLPGNAAEANLHMLDHYVETLEQLKESLKVDGKNFEIEILEYEEKLSRADRKKVKKLIDYRHDVDALLATIKKYRAEDDQELNLVFQIYWNISPQSPLNKLVPENVIIKDIKKLEKRFIKVRKARKTIELFLDEANNLIEVYEADITIATSQAVRMHVEKIKSMLEDLEIIILLKRTQ